MYLHGKKISAVSQKENVMIKKAVISPGSSWSILQSLSLGNKQVQMESDSSNTLNYCTLALPRERVRNKKGNMLPEKVSI